jgi:hypothetical protein
VNHLHDPTLDCIWMNDLHKQLFRCTSTYLP